MRPVRLPFHVLKRSLCSVPSPTAVIVRARPVHRLPPPLVPSLRRSYSVQSSDTEANGKTTKVQEGQNEPLLPDVEALSVSPLMLEETSVETESLQELAVLEQRLVDEAALPSLRVEGTPRETQEGESFLPEDWKENMNDLLEETRQRQAKRDKQRRLKKLKSTPATSSSNIRALKKEAQTQVTDVVVQRILGGALSDGGDFLTLVAEAETFYKNFEEEHKVELETVMNTSLLRRFLVEHAEDDVVINDEGEPILDDKGELQVGKFQRLLMEDEDVWVALVEDEGWGSEMETLDHAFEALDKMRRKRRNSFNFDPKQHGRKLAERRRL